MVLLYVVHNMEKCPTIAVMPGGIIVTEKELRKMNRYQLLELLMIQTERVNSLEAQVEALKNQQVLLSNLGSMAEVSMQVSGVLDAAQKAAELYLEAAKVKAAQIEEDAKLRAGQETDKL